MSELRYSVRIKLSDFIKSKQEKTVIDAMHKCAESTGKKIFLKLWYEQKELTQKEVSDFIKKYEKQLEDIGTNIHMGEEESWTQKSWFNLRKESDKNDTSYRHEYVYSDIRGIIHGIEMFANMIRSMERQPVKSQVPQNIIRRENEERGKSKQNREWKPKHRIVIRRINNDK